MIRTDLLRGKLAEKGIAQSGMAKMLGITPKTFYDKMKRGVFNSDEMETMISVLHIENPIEIFFAKKDAAQATSGRLEQ